MRVYNWSEAPLEWESRGMGTRSHLKYPSRGPIVLAAMPALPFGGLLFAIYRSHVHLLAVVNIASVRP